MSEIYKIESGTVTDHTSSMPDGMNGLPPEVAAYINKKYGAREVLHIPCEQEHPFVMLPYERGNARHNGMLKIANWYRENLGVDFAAVSPNVITQAKAGISRDNIADLPLDTAVTARKNETDHIPVNFSPYFSMGYRNLSPDLGLIGVNPEQAEAAKNKATLNAELMEIGNNGNPEQNYAIPERTYVPGEDSTEVIGVRINEINSMYDSLHQFALEKNEQEIAEVIAQAETGLVFRPANMDGGFGNVFMSENQDGSWKITNGDEEQEERWQELSYSQALSVIENEALVKGWKYVVTRKVDNPLSPSIGVHIAEDGFNTMVTTGQKMDNTNTCVGGSSINVADPEFANAINGHDSFMREASDIVTNHFFDIEDQNPRAHIGWDWIIPGAIDQSIMNLLDAHPELMGQYGEEFARRFIVECNPRHTLLSHVTNPLARAVNWSRGSEQLAVNQDQVDALYGFDTESGYGAFDVNDFVFLPEDWIAGAEAFIAETGTSGFTREEEIGLLLTDWLMEYVTDFNQVNKGHMVMIPRVDAYMKDGHWVCSLATAAVPKHEGRSLGGFNNFVRQMDNGDGTATLIELNMDY